MATLKEKLEGVVPANDSIAEPFQPNRTSLMWSGKDLWCNREGTVIRSGLYLRDRKMTASQIDELSSKIDAVPTDIQDQLNTEITNRTSADNIISSELSQKTSTLSNDISNLNKNLSETNDNALINVSWDNSSRKLFQQRKGKEPVEIANIPEGVTDPGTLVSSQPENNLKLSTQDSLLYVAPPTNVVNSLNGDIGDVVITGENIPYSDKNSKTIKEVVDEITATAGLVTSVNGQSGSVVLNADDIKMSNGSDIVEDVINSKASSSDLSSLRTTVNSKADSSDVEKNTTDISTISGRVDSVEQSLSTKADTSSLGTAATKDTGNSSGQIPLIDTNGKLSSTIIPGENVALADGTVNSSATNPVLKYRIVNDVIYISGTIDVVSDNSSSGQSVKVGNIPKEYMPKKQVQGVGSVPISCSRLAQGQEKASVIVIGDDQTAESALGAVMFQVDALGTAKLTSGTWTFYGNYCLK